MGLFGSKKTPEEILAEGRELYGDFNFAKALKVLDKASGTLDGEPDYLIALIYMYCHQDDSITRKHLRIAADAGYEEAAWLREILYKEHTFTAEELFENGNEAYKKKKYKDAYYTARFLPPARATARKRHWWPDSWECSPTTAAFPAVWSWPRSRASS